MVWGAIGVLKRTIAIELEKEPWSNQNRESLIRKHKKRSSEASHEEFTGEPPVDTEDSFRDGLGKLLGLWPVASIDLCINDRALAVGIQATSGRS